MGAEHHAATEVERHKYVRRSIDVGKDTTLYYIVSTKLIGIGQAWTLYSMAWIECDGMGVTMEYIGF